MTFKHQLVYLIICLFVYWFIPVPQARAAGEFTADYEVGYAVSSTGVTIVTQQVTLTNQKSDFYPKQYTITIDSVKIQNIIARDDGGLITPTVNQKEGKTNITLEFNEQVVGLGKKLSFTLRYENLDFAKKNGTIWEVTVPGVKDDPDIGSYSVSLQVSPALGPNAYISPLPANGSKWAKEQMIRGGISAAYGKEQTFSLELNYYLENPKLSPVYTEVALPPDTSYQKVIITSLSPKPSTVRRDADGNWLARYELAPTERLTVTAVITARTFLSPRRDFTADVVDDKEYTTPLQYWESDAEIIKKLARQYPTPRAIYTYVSQFLSYDYNRAKTTPVRKGALAALSTPNESICMEFTDAFVAIARAAGIPAREVVGYAYTTNAKLRPLSLVSDVLHAWPEYYDRDKRLWVPVDPTWANTTGGVNYFDKLDFNHIAFAIHGKSSSYPYPAGFYRSPADSTKSIKIDFGPSAFIASGSGVSTAIDFPQKISSGFSSGGKVTVENTSGVALDTVSVNIQASPYSFSFSTIEHAVPPFAKLTYPITIDSTNYLEQRPGLITVSVNGQTTQKSFAVEPLFTLVIPGAVFGGGTILIVVYLLAHLHLWKKSKKH